MVSNALTNLGVYFGQEREFFPPDEKNPSGYFELKDQILLNRKLRQSFFLPPGSVETLPENWREYPFTADLVRSVASFLTRHFAGRPLWGFKQPWTSVLLPIYQEAFKTTDVEAHYLICVRNPLNVMASWNRKWYVGEARRTDPALGKVTMGVWVLFTLYALRLTRGYSRTVVLFEQFMSDPVAALKPLVDSVQGWEPEESAWQAIKSSIRPELDHSTAGGNELATLPSLFRRTYDLCKFYGEHPDALRANERDDELEALWEECVLTAEVFSMPFSTEAHFTFAWNTHEGPQNVEIDVPLRSWTPFKVKVVAPPRTQIQVTLFPNPSVSWFRSAVWKIGDECQDAVLKPGPADRIESEAGTQRLTSLWGPYQFTLETPSQEGPYEFEAEVLVHLHYSLAFSGALELATRLNSANQRIETLERHALEMESRMREALRKP